jgi:hypothetical protein
MAMNSSVKGSEGSKFGMPWTGIVLGIVFMLAGLVLFVNGLMGRSLVGGSSADVVLGIVLFVIGLVAVLLTRNNMQTAPMGQSSQMRADAKPQAASRPAATKKTAKAAAKKAVKAKAKTPAKKTGRAKTKSAARRR